MAEPIEPAKKSKPSSKPDIASLAGLVVAFGGILGGLLIEGGKLKDVTQFTAALIVLGGTSGAVMVSVPLKTLIGGVKRLAGVFIDSKVELEGMLEEVIGFATRPARTVWFPWSSRPSQLKIRFSRKP